MNIFLMNILDFKKMNILFEWIFWIFIKWITFWTNILVLVCLSQKWLSQDVSNSSEITDGSLVGPISVHFRGLLPILGPQEGSEAISWPHLEILNNFPHFIFSRRGSNIHFLYHDSKYSKHLCFYTRCPFHQPLLIVTNYFQSSWH